MVGYQIGGLSGGVANFSGRAVGAAAAMAGLIYLLFRKGYQDKEGVRDLRSVSAANV